MELHLPVDDVVLLVVSIVGTAQVLGDSEGMALSGHKTHRHYSRYVNFQKEDISKIAAKLAAIKSKVSVAANEEVKAA